MSKSSNLSNQIFGQWTVSEKCVRSAKKNSRYVSILWLCTCQCGTQKYVNSRSLLSGSSTNCGCLRRKPIVDFTGRTFGFWKVLNRTPDKLYYWVCQCKCGNIKNVNHNSLNSGGSKTCGCELRENVNKLKYGESSFNLLIKNYRKRIKNDNRDCDLTNDDFKTLFQSNCYYCNIEPSQVIRKDDYFGEFKYNGIDRVDSSQGYLISNCRPCCKTCNFAKNSLSEKEFYLWVKRINNNLTNKGII